MHLNNVKRSLSHCALSIICAPISFLRNLEEDDNASEHQHKRARTETDDDDDVMDVEAPPPGVVRGEGVLGGREVSVSRLFTEDDRKVAVKVVWHHGGHVVPQLRGDYHLMPLEVAADHMPQTEVAVVTMIWLVSL